MGIQINTKLAIVILGALVVAVGSVIFLSEGVSLPGLPSISLPEISLPEISFPPILPPSTPLPAPTVKDIKRFSSEEEFKEYLERAESVGYYMLGIGGMGAAPMMEEAVSAPGITLKSEGAGAIPERVSETTVQVLGIDEPDIVKTDGQEIYFSSKGYYWRRFLETEIGIFPPPEIQGETKVVKAFPPEDLEVEAKVEKGGDLLLYQKNLVIFGEETIYGYDVSNPKNPEKKWTMDLENNNYVVASRLYNGKIYLITRSRINTYHPCPIRPLSVDGTPLEIKCVDIYHPVVSVPVDVTYNAVVFKPASGQVEKNISFVGTSNSSVLYMSRDALYVSYSYYESIVKFYSSFFKEKCQDIVPSWVVDRLEKLAGYDISEAAKLTEFQVIFESYYNTLDDDERLRVQNELTNRMGDYYNEHKREVETTGIIKVGLDKFAISASGNIPGKPLNQFSLDEYENHLRIAITVGEGVFGWGWGIGGTRQSANDVYVLDKNLKITGSIKDMGLEERIYSVRFIEDKGYVVTFRQIDPFFVLDLSNPQQPELKGQLKIPGYSSYLHPITKDKILGIGKEGSQVKISLFDVQNPQEPKEAAKYLLDEYWSDILNTHHAFLLDEKHEIFFLPGARGGYIFSYQGDELKLTRAVSDIRAKRAVYIENFLYIIGDDKMVVLNELNWEKVKEMEF